MQPTKPNIPTKNKNSADPDIRKFRDSEVNAIVAGFEKVDENFEEVENELNNIAEPDIDQFIELNGRYTLRTDKVYTAGTTMLFDVPRQYGMHQNTANAEHNKPRYYFFGISRTGAFEVESEIWHSSPIIPERLVNPKPISPRELPYDDQAAMLADQSGQTSGEHYYYSGSTSAWLWNGASNGLISDYTEKVEGTDWEEWGTKPQWLIITGDAYLVGIDNLNKMTGTFHRRYDDGGTTLFDVVVLNIEAFTGGNLDTEESKLEAVKILDVQFNENKDLTLDSSLENNSIYSDLIPVIVPASAGDATWNNLGDGNYSLQTGNNATAGLRSRTEATIPNNLIRIFSANKLTIIARLRIRANTTTNVDRIILGNWITNEGWRLFYQNSTQDLRFQAADLIRNTAGSSLILNTHDEFVCVAAVYEGGFSGTVKLYIKSTPRSIPFTLLATIALENKVIDANLPLIRFDRHQSTSTTANRTDRDYTYLYADALTDSQVNALMTE